MIKTGVFATDDQKQLMRDAMQAPYIVVGGYGPRSPQQVAHDCALKCGLPEIEGYYGCDLLTGEFVSA
jgi:hypothetical protein